MCRLSAKEWDNTLLSVEETAPFVCIAIVLQSGRARGTGTYPCAPCVTEGRSSAKSPVRFCRTGDSVTFYRRQGWEQRRPESGRHNPPPSFLANSACASSMMDGSSIRSMAAAASTLPAQSSPLCPMDVAPIETFCQEWPGAPAAKQDVPICAVGVSQLTSPTSVEPFSTRLLKR